MRIIDAHRLKKCIHEFTNDNYMSVKKILEMIDEQPTLDEIKPCACICGNKNIGNYYHGMYPERYFYICNNCKIQSKFGTTLKEAISNWNELICELSNIEYKGYKPRIRYSNSDKCFFGAVEGLRDLVSFGGTNIEEAINSFHEAVDGYIEINKLVDYCEMF